MKRNLYLLGGGGHCKSALDVIASTGIYNVQGIVDLPEKLGDHVCGIEVVATDDNLKDLVSDTVSFLITLGFIESPAMRVRFYETLVDLNAQIPSIISPRALVSNNAEIGQGTIVMHDALVNAAAVVGKNCIVNSKALIEHDASVGDHTQISTGAIVNGGCRVGEEVFVGSGSVLVHGISIARGTVVGAGTVVHRDIVEAGVYVGNPLHRIS